MWRYCRWTLFGYSLLSNYGQSIQRIAPCAAGMYWYLSEITSQTQSCNIGYLQSGHPVFTWAGVWRSAVVIRSQKGSSSKAAWKTLLHRHSGPSVSTVWPPATPQHWHVLWLCNAGESWKLPADGSTTADCAVDGLRLTACHEDRRTVVV